MRNLIEVDSAFSITSEHSEIGHSVTEECYQVTLTRDRTKSVDNTEPQGDYKTILESENDATTICGLKT